MALTSPSGTIQWIEPVESLDYGEHILGGVTSTHLTRGHLGGYGVYLTNKRIIGVERKRIGLVVFSAGLGGTITYLTAIFILHLDPLVLLFLPFLLTALDYFDKRVTHWVGERFLARGDADLPRQLKRKRDFEANRAETYSLQTTRYSSQKGTLNLVFKEPKRKMVSVKISGKGDQFLRLGNLIAQFSKLPPPVRFQEF
jgi:hypothetical protein